MKQIEEDAINGYLEGNFNENDLTERSKKIINIYEFIIKNYFSCEESVINNVKNKLIENFYM